MSVGSAQAKNRILLRGISWSTFESLADSDQAGKRFTYDRGYLEITAPSGEHEHLKRALGRMVETMTDELGIPIRSGGSATLRSQLKDRGLEPDESYYVASESRVRGGKRINLAVDPPPDLTIEVDISSSSLDQLSIYATLGVPEVWLYDGAALEVCQLQPDKTYAKQTRSPAFPFLPLDEVERFLARRNETDETTWIRSFRAWVKTLGQS